MIFDYFRELILNNFGHNPTTQQQEVVEALAEFILRETDSEASADKQKLSARNADVFILQGYAGTGKTSLVSALVKTMEQLERHCVLMAPTGRAAKVFSLYSGHEAFTIHKRIYRQKSIEDDTIFSMGYNMLKNALFIVDEASMISNDASNSIYGTGRLLDDLIQFVYSSEGCRLILLGDTAQLPPVGDTKSPALQPEVLMGYGLSVACMTLSQVVRQRDLSGILQNATLLRGLISQPIQSAMFNPQWKADVRNVPGNELVEEISNCYHHYGIDDTIVVCRSNKRAHVYNMGIRNQILDREEELASGDLIMIVKNNYYWKADAPLAEETPEGQKGTSLSFIANGDIAQVMRVRNERELYGFRFADCELRFPDYDNMELTATVLLDTLHTEAPALPHEMSEQLWNRVLEDYADIPYKKERMKKMKEDPYYNALQIKYAYAVTCHKAQGGQWSQVFIDQGYITPEMIGLDYYRWLYTAFTRATDNVYLVNWPKKDSQD
ncbi:MAG: AAA family ATPase [Bacteroidaceae bacterium]|nr:AAA family ATPase [Bacteroidaceae bacterium]